MPVRPLRQATDTCGRFGLAHCRIGDDMGFDEIVPEVRDQLAERTENARRRWHHNARHLQLARHRAAVHRPRAAEGNKREIARIIAALDRDDPNATHDIGMRHAQDARRRLMHVEAQGRRNYILNDLESPLEIERHRAAEPRVW